MISASRWKRARRVGVVDQVLRHDLHGDAPAETHVLGLEDGAHAAFVQCPQDAVRAAQHLPGPNGGDALRYRYFLLSHAISLEAVSIRPTTNAHFSTPGRGSRQVPKVG